MVARRGAGAGAMRTTFGAAAGRLAPGVGAVGRAGGRDGARGGTTAWRASGRACTMEDEMGARVGTTDGRTVGREDVRVGTTEGRPGFVGLDKVPIVRPTRAAGAGGKSDARLRLGNRSLSSSTAALGANDYKHATDLSRYCCLARLGL